MPEIVGTEGMMRSVLVDLAVLPTHDSVPELDSRGDVTRRLGD